MSYHDRNYSAGGGRGWSGGGSGGGFGGDVGQRILGWLNASFSIGTYLGIRVRVHITFILFIVFQMIGNRQPAWTLRWMAILFGSVLLHEFGHCLACRRVGGTANDILMWPLGGLAFCAPPRRPWPEFVTVVWGPLVNIIIAAGCYAVLLAWFGADTPVSLNPFVRYLGAPPSALAWLVADLFVVNYVLALFNLALIFYPFDAGRLIQIAVWWRTSYARSMRFAATFGMVGAVAVALLGLATNNTMLVVIAAFGFFTCLQQKRLVDAGYVQEEFSYARAGSNERKGPGLFARWKQSRADTARRRERETRARQDERVDQILAKVGMQGLQSLTPGERRVLEEAGKRDTGR